MEDAAINVVYVATLKPTHKPVVMMALAHGKHVLCEKVMAVNRSEAEEMIRFAKSKELFLMEVCNPGGLSTFYVRGTGRVPFFPVFFLVEISKLTLIIYF